MATFEIQAPDGSVYQIDGATDAGAVSALKKLLDAEAKPKASNAQAQFDAAPFYANGIQRQGDMLAALIKNSRPDEDPSGS